ncbi:MAG: type II toxin-antitoxin system Phd/YefM family antitoxin [Mogibacterium sp.]|nr:type II toxin-antitoxin system Phd/YefM family antitoxin [Mogibacterium sp.]
MPTIKPISDLRNYNTVLDDVRNGSPVYLTRNGHGVYAVVDIHEMEELLQIKAAFSLLQDLNRGIKRGQDEGWLSAEDLRQHFRERADEL